MNKQKIFSKKTPKIIRGLERKKKNMSNEMQHLLRFLFKMIWAILMTYNIFDLFKKK